MMDGRYDIYLINVTCDLSLCFRYVSLAAHRYINQAEILLAPLFLRLGR